MKYDPKKSPKKAEELALKGLLNKQIATAMGIDRATLYRWQTAHGDFRDSLKAGKEVVDDSVEASLYSLTQYREDVTVTEERDDETGLMVVTKRVVQTVAPVPSADIFWLKNRRSTEWRDKHETSLTDADGNSLQGVVFEVVGVTRAADGSREDSTS